ncbi:unnamed protein product, partial [Mesorhabditis belari]|uniref:Uncharacterized protein n=1 Tax=Mesorhabditis belari TaxID=2138241 RepID=A0AAF3FSY3_9BILA
MFDTKFLFLIFLFSILFSLNHADQKTQKPPPKLRPQIHFKLGRTAHQELRAFEYYFPGNEIGNIFLENDKNHPILDKLNQFIADTNISERVRNEFKIAKIGYKYLTSLSEDEKKSIAAARQLLGHVAELLERLPIDRAVRISRLIPLPDFGPLLNNKTNELMGPRERTPQPNIWEQII